MHTRHLLGPGLAAALAAVACGQPTAFTAGNLVVTQVADGTASPINNTANPVFLKEITTLGAVVQTIALRALAQTAGNRALTRSGTATSEGTLTRSVDGRYLILTGYNADAGTPA